MGTYRHDAHALLPSISTYIGAGRQRETELELERDREREFAPRGVESFGKRGVKRLELFIFQEKGKKSLQNFSELTRF